MENQRGIFFLRRDELGLHPRAGEVGQAWLGRFQSDVWLGRLSRLGWAARKMKKWEL
jgi:hypothetical protein